MTKRDALRKAIKKADTALSLYVRARDKSCVICGSRERLQAGHLITRNAKSVRYDLRNVWTQCASCNFKHEYRPEVFTQWWIERFGSDAYWELVEDSKKLKKWTVEELEALTRDFQSKYNQLNGDHNAARSAW